MRYTVERAGSGSVPARSNSMRIRRGPQAGLGPAHGDDGGLKLGRRPMGAAIGPRRPVGQVGHAAVAIAAQPAVHTVWRVTPTRWATSTTVAPVDEHLRDCLVALFHQSQLHQHGRPPSCLRARTPTAKEVATGAWWTLPSAAVSPGGDPDVAHAAPHTEPTSRIALSSVDPAIGGAQPESPGGNADRRSELVDGAD